jgi:hypothetical protein
VSCDIMRNLESTTIVLLIVLAMILVGILFKIYIPEIAVAQPNPCPEGQFPKIDSNGQIIIDHATKEPVCVLGP